MPKQNERSASVDANRSAEWYRGALRIVETMPPNRHRSIDEWEVIKTEYRSLLAAAEAREATQPTTAEDVRKALEKAHWIGCSPHEWPTVDDIPLLCHALIAEHSRAESAAEVIAACERALEDSRDAIAVLAGACQMAGVPPRVFAGHGMASQKTLTAIAKWKEAHANRPDDAAEVR